MNISSPSYLQSIPEFIVPENTETSNESTSQLENQPTNEQTFGGEQSQTNGSTEQTFELVTGVSNGMASSNSLPAPSLILTGALALTAIAAAMKVVNDAQKKREEEEAQSYQQAKNQAAKLNAIEEAKKAQQLIDGRNEFYASLAELNLTDEQLLEVLNTASTNGLGTATTQAQGFNTANLAQQQTAYDIYRQGEYQSVPIQNNNPFANSSVGSGGVSSSSGGFLSNLWNTGLDYVENISNTVLEIANDVKDYAINTWNQVTTWASNVYNNVSNAVTNFAMNAWNTATNWVSNTYTNITTTLSNNPTAAWATAGVITLTTITTATLYALNCIPTLSPPSSSILNFAGVFSLPAVGWFTTNKKQRRYGLIIGMLFLGMLISACGGTPSSAPAGTPTSTLCPPTSTPTLPPVPTTTPIPWLANITDPNLLFSNWVDLFGNSYLNQNEYNWAVVQAANQYNIPAWVLKALVAHESSFNPSATNQLRAVGLTGMTGNGISFIIENINNPPRSIYK